MNGSAVVAVQLAELVLHRLVAHDDPAPAAEVAAGRRLLGEVDAVEQELVVDRALEVEPAAHGAGRGEHLVDVGEGGGVVDVHGTASGSRRAGTCLWYGAPAIGSRWSLEVSLLGTEMCPSPCVCPVNALLSGFVMGAKPSECASGCSCDKRSRCPTPRSHRQSPCEPSPLRS